MPEAKTDGARVTMICPNLACSKPVAAPVSMRGKVVRCAHCNTNFLVPRDSKPVVPAAVTETTQGKHKP